MSSLKEIIIYAYDDTASWGNRLVGAALKNGMKAKLFNSSEEVPNEENVVVFLRMRNTLKTREKNKSLAEEIAKKDRALMIPRLHECRLYDNKLAQLNLFKKWMPKTWHTTSSRQAQSILSEIECPFVSKSSEGSSSKNVRLIENEAAARKEIKSAFSGQGILMHYGQRQKGYLLWQKFVRGNVNDWRVGIIAKKYAFVSKRYNRPDVPFASGSGKIENVDSLNNESRNILDYSLQFAREFNLTFAALDIVLEGKLAPRILEVSSGWIHEAFSGSVVYEKVKDQWVPTSSVMDDMFGLVVKSIARGYFNV